MLQRRKKVERKLHRKEVKLREGEKGKI